jgi:hypothetical protein
VNGLNLDNLLAESVFQALVQEGFDLKHILSLQFLGVLFPKGCNSSIGRGISNHSTAMAVVRRRGDFDVDVLAKIVEESE